jgi:hypothetical protein
MNLDRVTVELAYDLDEKNSEDLQYLARILCPAG